ncbi:MAG: acyltransferase [Ktedonobacteraceae bacterium]|nr:acyltransferase [Ktedonobacteraceae bacterium]
MDPNVPQDKLASLLLLVFILVNQAYFMGCFFLISGYFTPGSFDRKGSGVFYKDRLLRLDIPLIVFVFLLSPIASLGFYQTPAGFPHLTPPLTWQQLPSLLGVGPLWFAEMLLFFCLGYVLWRRLQRTRAQSTEHVDPPPSYLAVGLFVLALALVSYLMRIVVPFGLFIPILRCGDMPGSDHLLPPLLEPPDPLEPFSVPAGIYRVYHPYSHHRSVGARHTWGSP